MQVHLLEDENMPVCLHASLLTVSNCHVCVGGGDRERGETKGERNGGGRKRGRERRGGRKRERERPF